MLRSRLVTKQHHEAWGGLCPKTREGFLRQLHSKRKRMARIRKRSLEGEEEEGLQHLSSSVS